MRHVLLFLSLTLGAYAQAATDRAAKSPDANAAKQVDSKLHADAARLVELSGAKQRAQDNLKPMVEEGKRFMMERCKTCSPKFTEEWEKRMLERINVNDFVDVYVRVYEKYFTDAEILELITLGEAKKASRTASPSPSLKQKLDSVMPSLRAEAISGCTQVGAKLGGEIGDEIGREHPEWVNPPPKPGKP